MDLCSYCGGTTIRKFNGRESWLHLNGDLTKQACNKCYDRDYYNKNRDHILNNIRKNIENNKERYRQYKQRHHLKKRIECLNHYSNGTMSCACCGEKQIEFLTIDHINGDGNKHRKQIKGTLVEWLKRNNYPSGFQILCWNCNCSKAHYKTCPHNRGCK